MFGWFRKKKQPELLIKGTQFPEDYIVISKISTLIRGAITDNSMLRQTARPNCAIVLDEHGDVFLQWISETDNLSHIVSFALVGQLSTYRELLEYCVGEIKAGTFGAAFIDGPGHSLIDRVAIEALNKMKHP